MIRHILTTTATLCIMIALVTQTSAAGVAMPYWDSNPLYMSKGETKIIDVELQNIVGESISTFKATLASSENIASIKGQDTYTLNAGERKNVQIEIKVPQDAELGTQYKVTLTVQEAKSSQPGEFSLGSAFENSFNVIVGEKLPAKSPGLSSSRITVYMVVAIALLIGLIIWFSRRKTKNV